MRESCVLDRPLLYTMYYVYIKLAVCTHMYEFDLYIPHSGSKELCFKFWWGTNLVLSYELECRHKFTHTHRVKVKT